MQDNSPVPQSASKHPFRDLIALGEHSAFWGGVGIIVGAATVTLNMKILFSVGWLCFVFAIVRTTFLGSHWRILGNAGLALFFGVALFFAWRVIPKSKDPATPDQIAAAIRKMESDPSRRQFTTPESPTQESPSPAGMVSKETPGEKKRITPRKPEPALGSSSNPTQLESQESKTRTASHAFTVSQISSEVPGKPDAPYKTRVTIQTDEIHPALRLLLTCSGTISSGTAQVFPGGMMMNTGNGVVAADKRLFAFYYGLADPAFGPSNPLQIDLFSAQPIVCERADTY